MSAGSTGTLVLTESPADGKRRFELELEFVCLCADPSYLQFLGSQGLFGQASFIKWLRYLRDTWSKPAYAAHVRFPLGLTHLHQLVEDDSFRERMSKHDQAMSLRQAELDLWKGRGEQILKETALFIATEGGDAKR
jgi:mediator of RNA polymerase II transcription subunit 31